jgi:hypothetical protein
MKMDALNSNETQVAIASRCSLTSYNTWLYHPGICIKELRKNKRQPVLSFASLLGSKRCGGKFM